MYQPGFAIYITLALMSPDDSNLAALRIVEAVRAAFPEEAAMADAILLRDGYDEDAHFIWLEHFSQFTTDAINRLDFTRATDHLNLLSGIVAGGDEPTVRCIDVAYVESLMWDIKDDKLKREGWRLIPVNLRALYVAMWGEWPFMKGAS
jgi:hypothetical protein